jgi:flagellar hook protein FlgE
MPSFSIPLSGLDASSTELSVIANNLANLNTVGFKSQRTLFQDLFYQQVGTSGDGNPVQVGVGASVAAIGADLTQGSVQTSGVPTDVAIQGDGFFIVNQGGETVYTRAGDLSLGPTGLLLTQDGGLVQGNPAVNGVISNNATLGPLSISTGLTNPPKPTGNVQLSLNLDSGTAVNGTFSTAIVVHDALGASHVLTYNFTKTAANSWNYSITIPAADVGQTGAPVVIKSGTLTFDGSGQLLTPAANVAGITITGLADGANNLTFNWNLFDPNSGGLLTQVSGASATSATQQDGFSSGSLLNFTIGSDGVIQGVFSNGQTNPIGQIAIATFANEQGLIRNGSNNFLASLSSGAANVGTAGTGGRGTLSGGALEQSNVDIATQFAELIVAERSYQANAKSITTFDQVTQTAINLVQ